MRLISKRVLFSPVQSIEVSQGTADHSVTLFAGLTFHVSASPAAHNTECLIFRLYSILIFQSFTNSTPNCMA